MDFKLLIYHYENNYAQKKKYEKLREKSVRNPIVFAKKNIVCNE